MATSRPYDIQIETDVVISRIGRTGTGGGGK